MVSTSHKKIQWVNIPTVVYTPSNERTLHWSRRSRINKKWVDDKYWKYSMNLYGGYIVAINLNDEIPSPACRSDNNRQL